MVPIPCGILLEFGFLDLLVNLDDKQIKFRNIAYILLLSYRLRLYVVSFIGG